MLRQQLSAHPASASATTSDSPATLSRTKLSVLCGNLLFAGINRISPIATLDLPVLMTLSRYFQMIFLSIPFACKQKVSRKVCSIREELCAAPAVLTSSMPVGLCRHGLGVLSVNRHAIDIGQSYGPSRRGKERSLQTSPSLALLMLITMISESFTVLTHTYS